MCTCGHLWVGHVGAPWGQQTYKPSSVPPHPCGAVVIYLGPPLPTASSGQPRDRPGVLVSLYLALLRVGFAQPAGLPTAGALLPHHFTLTPTPRFGQAQGRLLRAGAVCFCGTFRRVAPPGYCPAPSPGGARTFLPSAKCRAATTRSAGPSQSSSARGASQSGPAPILSFGDRGPGWPEHRPGDSPRGKRAEQ
jgi:hypothetical protein